MRDFMIETSYLRNNSIPGRRRSENETNSIITESISNNQSCGSSSGNKMKNFLIETAELRKNMISDEANLNNKNENSSCSSVYKTLKSLPVNFTNSNYTTSNSNGRSNSWLSTNTSASGANKNISDFESRVKYLSDFDFKNPDFNMINNPSFKVNDDIGRKCLDLTNEFRKKHRMPLLK